MHDATHCEVQFSEEIIESYKVLLDRDVGIDLEVGDLSVDPRYVFSGVAVEITFQVGVDQDGILSMETNLRKIVNRAIKSMEKIWETSPMIIVILLSIVYLQLERNVVDVDGLRRRVSRWIRWRFNRLEPRSIQKRK